MTNPADSDHGASLDRLVYLRGPYGAHDRLTLYAGGLGTLPGTGPGGLTLDGKPLSGWKAGADELVLDMDGESRVL